MGAAVITGTVVDASGEPVPGADVHVATGDEEPRTAATDDAGRFTVPAPSSGEAVVTIFSRQNLTWRRRLRKGYEPDLRIVRLAPAERDAGIHGQAWDLIGDRPVTRGFVSLRRGSKRVARTHLADDGSFSFPMSASRAMPGGVYELEVNAPGFVSASQAVTVVDDVTLYLVGRVELQPQA